MVTAKGKDDDLTDVMNYAGAIIHAAVKYSSKKIFCDERELEYSISLADTYKLADEAAKYAAALVKIVIVCNKKYLQDGKFYETVATNRGLKVHITSDYDEALKWLE